MHDEEAGVAMVHVACCQDVNPIIVDRRHREIPPAGSASVAQRSSRADTCDRTTESDLGNRFPAGPGVDAGQQSDELTPTNRKVEVSARHDGQQLMPSRDPSTSLQDLAENRAS